MKLFSTLAAAATIALSAAAAQAAPIALVTGDKFQVNFKASDDNINDSADDFLGATALFTVNGVGSDTVDLSVLLSNTGSSTGGFNSRITVFGFYTPGLVSTGTSVSGIWTERIVGNDIAPTAHGIKTALGANSANICATTGNNCGNGTDGVDAGGSGTVNFSLKYGALFGDTAPTIDNFFIRLQRITYGQGASGSGSGGGIATGIIDCVTGETCNGGGNGGDPGNGGGNGGSNGGGNGGDPGNGGGNGGGDVPEPATMALLGAALVGASAARRRK